MNHRKSVLFLCVALLLYTAGHYLVWKLWTEQLIAPNGDLSRMGYVSASKTFRANYTDLPKQHIEGTDYRGGPIDMVTIGDSFSRGGAGGKNRYYQDYIASLYGLKVVNLAPLELQGENVELTHYRTVVRLANSGWLRDRGVKYLLLESTEWICADRFSRKFDLAESDDPARLSDVYAKYVRKSELPEVGFMNNGNLKWLIQPISYKLSGRDFKKKVYKSTLNQDFFTAKDSRTLLFFAKNITSTPRITADEVNEINAQLNLLADLLSKQGITLIFMPAVDKYNLYSDYIINNKHPKSTFFEKLRPLPKRYRFIDTKAILMEGLRKGFKDVYYADDTHWGWKASEMIFTSEKF